MCFDYREKCDAQDMVKLAIFMKISKYIYIEIYIYIYHLRNDFIGAVKKAQLKFLIYMMQ